MKNTENFVNSIIKNKNVKAYKVLENILKEKCSKKISKILNKK